MKKTTKTPSPTVSRIFREFPVQAALRNVANPRGSFPIYDRGTLLPSTQRKWLISVIDDRRGMGDDCETLEYRGDVDDLEGLAVMQAQKDNVDWRIEILEAEVILSANP